MRRRLPRRAVSALALCISLAIFAAGCGKKESSDAALGAVVARVNGQPIHEADAAREANNLIAAMGPSAAGAHSDPAVASQFRERAIQNLIDRKLLLERAQLEGVSAKDEEVTAEFEKLKAQFPDTAAFRAKMAQFEMSEDEVRTEIRAGISLTHLQEKLMASYPAATPDDAAKYYAEHPQEFVSPEEVRASHILIRSAESDSAAVRGEARKKTEQILAELKGGRDFAEAAKQHSQDPGSAQSGGDLGFFARERMVPQFSEAAFSLEVGKTSGVVETPFGFHIVKVTDKHPSRTIPIEEVRDKIVQYLDQTRESRAMQDAIKEARAKAKIEMVSEGAKG
jgi:parvulin-like peptidyl-prolyl isomerase